MVLKNASDAINEGNKLIRDTMKKSDNSKEVFDVISEQVKINSSIDKDAMDEINPYLEQGA